MYAAGRKGATSCVFCRRTETGGGKIPIKKAGLWGQENINIFCRGLDIRVTKAENDIFVLKVTIPVEDKK